MSERDFFVTRTVQSIDHPVVASFTSSSSRLCPDLLRYEQIGAADGLRGRVVRGFFWLLRAWPTRG